jgi:mannitol-1-/sugar-/sorbitol-6-phosphatase
MTVLRTAVLFDVDGTLVDAVDNQRGIWAVWAEAYGLDPQPVYDLALRTRPAETVAALLPESEHGSALEQFHRLEDEDVLTGRYTAFDGAGDLLRALEGQEWALVTSNHRHRVEGRFHRLSLPLPSIIVDAAATERGKPHPEPYLAAAAALGIEPAACLVVEDSPSGVDAGLRAGMTVWSVNGAERVPGSQRHFTSLSEAATDVVAWAAGRRAADGRMEA